MELMRTSLDKLYKQVYIMEGRRIPEDVLGRITRAVSTIKILFNFLLGCRSLGSFTYIKYHSQR